MKRFTADSRNAGKEKMESQEYRYLLNKSKKAGLTRRISQKLHMMWMDIVGLALIADNRVISMSYKQNGRSPFPPNFRCAGLEYLLERAKGMTILDVGMYDGLVGYEFARHEARLVHGIDKRLDSIGFCQRLFRWVPCESKFMYADLTKRIPDIGTYDIVLLLSTYFWLKQAMSGKDLENLLRGLLRKTKRYFAVRSALVDEVGLIARSEGFVERVRGNKPLTCVYEREK